LALWAVDCLEVFTIDDTEVQTGFDRNQIRVFLLSGGCDAYDASSEFEKTFPLTSQIASQVTISIMSNNERGE
jgi:hypothetical protein